MTLLGVCLLLPGEALAAKRPAPPDVVEDALAFATTDREKAIRLLEEALAAAPAAERGVIALHAGEQRRLAGDDGPARDHFGAVAGRAGTELAAAKLGLALLDAKDGVAAVLGALEDAPDKEVLATQNADRYLLLAIEAGKRDDAKAVNSAAKKALAFAREDAEVLARIQDVLAALARGETPAPEPQGEPIALAEAAWAEGDREQATRYAEKAAAAATTPEAKVRAEGLLEALRGAPEDRNRVAVLLPLTGKWEQVGKQVQDAIEFGYGTAPRTLTFVDTGATPEGAVAALEKAVLEDGVVAVVGPLLSEETEGVVARAEALHVPLLSLSQAYEDTAGHQWALQAMYTRADQIEALLDYAFEQRQMDAFAVFAPDSPFGQHAVELFAAGVQRRGGTITTQASYAAEETNLVQYAKKLGTRVGNLGELRREAVERGGNANTVVIPPKIDFDAIFLPESATRTPLACAALAYEEFPMGDFSPVKNGPVVPLLGLSGWNTTTLVAAGNEYTRNSLFPDVFSAPVAGEADPFVVAYRQETGRTPTALEAAAVDAGKLLAAAARSPAATRPAFRDALVAAQVTDAVTGATGFDPETLRARRTMRILTISRTTVEQVGTVDLP